MQNTKPLIATALLLSLAACGGGGSSGFVPAPAPAPAAAAAAPAPAPAPAPDVVAPPPAAPDVVAPPPAAPDVVAPPPAAPDVVDPPAPAPPAPPVVEPPAAPAPPAPPKTWVDADCSQTGTALPKCGYNFSANNANATVVMEGGTTAAIQLETRAGPLSATPSPMDGKYGHKAMLGLTLLHEVKLSEFPGLAFDMKLNSAASGDTTIQSDAYVTTAVSLTCDGLNWINLVAMTSAMEPVVGVDGYSRYSIKPSEAKWYKTGDKPYPTTAASDPSTALLHGANGVSGGAMALDKLIAAFPKACIYNWPHPTATVTPAMQFILGDTTNTYDKKAWIKSIAIGTKSVF